MTPKIIKTEPLTEKPEVQSHKSIPERILKMIKKMKADEKKYEELEKLKKTEKIEPVTVPLLPDEGWSLEMTTEKPEEVTETEEPIEWPVYKEVEPTAITEERPLKEQVEATSLPPVTGMKEREETLEEIGLHGEHEEAEIKHPEEEMTLPEEEVEHPEEEVEHPKYTVDQGEEENSSKKKFSKGTLNPTDGPPKTFRDNEGLPEDEGAKHHPGKVGQPHPGKPSKPHQKKPYFKQVRSPAAFAAVIGLSCGALVIMLGIIVALVMRRNRGGQGRVYIPDTEPEDQEHLIKMQKSGYENPTYKFFYY